MEKKLSREISPIISNICTAFITLALVFIYLSSSLETQILSDAQASQRSAADEVLFVTDSQTVKLMSLGYQQAAADIIWLRSIQYFVTHLLTDRRYPWLEHFIYQMIDLDPKFKHVYLWAGSCILYGGEITPSQVKASNRIYKAALKRFPNDYEPAYRLGMNYYSELRVDDPQEREKYQALGIAYFERAAQAPNAPPTVFDLLRGIAKQMKRDDVLFYAITDELVRVTDPERRKHLEARLQRLSEKIQREGQSTSLISSPSDGQGLTDWLNQSRQHEKERQHRTPYLKPLEYEWIFGQKKLPLAWQELRDSFTQPQYRTSMTSFTTSETLKVDRSSAIPSGGELAR